MLVFVDDREHPASFSDVDNAGRGEPDEIVLHTPASPEIVLKQFLLLMKKKGLEFSFDPEADAKVCAWAKGSVPEPCHRY